MTLFLGLGSLHWGFVPNFSSLAAPLSKNLENGEPRKFHTFMQEEHKSLSTLQDKLVSATVLALPTAKGHSPLDKYACDK